MLIRHYRSRWGTAIIIAILGLFGIFLILPLVLNLTFPFKSDAELALFPPTLFPKEWTLKKFKDFFSVSGTMVSMVPISRYFFNSILVAVFATAGHVLFASLAAYPMAKHKFPGVRALSQLIIFALMFSPEVLGIPRFQIMSSLRLIDTYGAAILPMIASTLGLFLMQQFMTQIPDSLIESARVEGANELYIWSKVVMPLVKPAWLTLLLLSFRDVWSDVQSTVLYVYNEAIRTLPGYFSFLTGSNSVYEAEYGSSATALGTSVSMALVGTFFLMLPPILIFLFTQSKVIETMRNAGIKE